MPANGRLTINVETVDPQLAECRVSTTVTSDVEIVVERAMYWPNISLGWQEAHNSFGVTAPACAGASPTAASAARAAFQTYILLANPNPVRRKCRCAS